MEDLHKFITNYINEAGPGRPKKVTNAEDVNVDKIPSVVKDGKKGPKKTTPVKPGVPANNNGTNNKWSFDAPDPHGYEAFDKKNLSTNIKQLANAFQSEENFIIFGKAGWGKTDLIVDTAKRFGYHVITVYLDKAEPTELQGIPISRQSKSSERSYTDYSMPPWAVQMLEMMDEDPDVKFLLFFDEMNQAQPDVLNALMPIALKHEICSVKFDNIIVGAAGNRSDENSSVTDIESQKPLMARFPTKIDWETNTPKTWADHFEWAHKNWDSKIGADVINKIAEYQDILSSPRDITLGLYNWIYKNKSNNFLDDPSLIKKRIEKNMIWDEAYEKQGERTVEKLINDLSTWLFNYMEDDGSAENKNSRRRTKNAAQVKKEDRDMLINALKVGFISTMNDDTRMFVTLENCITDVFDPSQTGITAEVLNRIVKDMEADGIKIMYKTNEEARKSAKFKDKFFIDPSGYTDSTL